MPNYPRFKREFPTDLMGGRKPAMGENPAGKGVEVGKSESQDCHEWLKRHRKSFLSSKIVAMLEAAESSKQQMVGGIVTH